MKFIKTLLAMFALISTGAQCLSLEEEYQQLLGIVKERDQYVGHLEDLERSNHNINIARIKEYFTVMTGGGRSSALERQLKQAEQELEDRINSMKLQSAQQIREWLYTQGTPAAYQLLLDLQGIGYL